MPTRPKLAVAEAGQLQFKSFDQYVEEANANKTPFALVISDEETITVECPLGNDIIALSEAQVAQDIVAMATAIFHENAPRILQLTGTQRFTVLASIVNDVMLYYGVQGQQLPES